MPAVDIQQVIASTVRDELAPSIVRINVRERDNEGDDTGIYVVTVSIEADRPPDTRRMLGLTRKIRERLQEVDVRDGFPMMTFISSEEEHKSGLAFA